MRFTISVATLLSLGLASAAKFVPGSCAEASRFGNPTVSPSVVKPGDTIHIAVDLTCAVKQFNIVADFMDYTIVVDADKNNGHEQPIVLARRAIAPRALSDSFTVKIPHAFFVAGAPYNIIMTNVYRINGTDGSSVTVEGGVLNPITIKT